MSEKRNLQNDLRGTYARSWTVSVDQNGKRLLRAVLKAALPFFAGALGGIASGCSVFGPGAARARTDGVASPQSWR